MERPGEDAPGEDAPRERTPYSRAAVGLLDQIAERALDDDYYVVRPGRYSRSRGINTVATALVLAVFAMLVTVTAVQSYLDRPGRDAARQALAADVSQSQAQRDALEARVDTLEAEIAALEDTLVESPTARLLRIATGSVATRGDGLVLTISPVQADGVSDAELRKLLNELWLAGAEAISVNDQRWGALTSLRSAGGTITVNFRSIGPPFVVQVIGNREQIRDRLVGSGEDGYWERREDAGELTYTVVDLDDQALPSAPDNRTAVTYARPDRGEGGAA